MAAGNVKWRNHFGKHLAVSQKVKPKIIVGIKTSTSWWLLKRNENIHYHKICMQVFISALWIGVNTQKQPKCPSAGAWITKCGILTQWTDSAIKGNRLLCYAIEWSHAQGTICCMIPFIWKACKRQMYRDRMKNSGCLGLGVRMKRTC